MMKMVAACLLTACHDSEMMVSPWDASRNHGLRLARQMRLPAGPVGELFSDRYETDALTTSRPHDPPAPRSFRVLRVL